MRKGGGRESFANYDLINSLQWWSVREVFKKNMEIYEHIVVELNMNMAEEYTSSCQF